MNRHGSHGSGALERSRKCRRTMHAKKRHPERWRHHLIVCGNFHAFGHFLFAGHESYHDCYVGFFVVVLQREKLPKKIQDFKDDSFRHVLAHTLEVTIGTYTWMIADVTDPSPLLLLSNPETYEGAIQHAGGLVSFMYLRDVGTPALHWLLTGRDGDGGRAEKLHAHSFHVNRATTHKINCVMISLLAIMATTCVDPQLAGIIKELICVSATGRSLQFADRMLENINNMQEQRDGKFAAFDRSMHYSDDIEAMLHVAHAWEAAEKGDAASNDPITQAILNGAASVRAELRRRIGTDLTTPSDKNPW